MRLSEQIFRDEREWEDESFFGTIERDSFRRCLV